MKTELKPAGAKQIETLQNAAQEIGAEAQTKIDEVGRLTELAGQTIEDSHLAGQWKKSMERRLGDEAVMLKLLEEVAPVQADQIAMRSQQANKLASISRSFLGLAQVLAAQRGGGIDEENARELSSAQVGILNRAQRIRRAIWEAGDAASVKKFPVAQLDAIEAYARKNHATIQSVAARRTRRKPVESVRADQVKTPAQATKIIGERLEDPALGQRLLEVHDGLEGEAQRAFAENLSAMALLSDEATNAPNYAKTMMGWHHPSARSEYRRREHDGVSRYQSEDRQNASQVALVEGLTGVAEAKDPAQAIEHLLVKSFVKEIGISDEVAAGWNANAPAVRRALAHEAFVPLRALNETISDMSPDPALTPEVEKAVHAIIQHMVEGDYREWRYDNEVSARQLSGMTPEQTEGWKANLNTDYQAKGLKLSTREEDDVELLWLTKIGGPSHGFDYGGHCLLPLLSNGRTKAILVDHDDWPHNAAARSYIRVLHTEDGQPTLYLEPFQRDFPHRQRFPDELDNHLYAAVINHAKQKAEALGLELSIGPRYGHLVEALGIDAKIVEKPLVLKKSNGVFEASDTLGLGHDFHQQVDMTTPPLQRLQFTPGG